MANEALKGLKERTNLEDVREYIRGQELEHRKLERSEYGDTKPTSGGYIEKNIKDRAINALFKVGNDELAEKLKNCSVGQRCQSIYCPICRKSLVSSQRNKYDRSIAKVEQVTGQKIENKDLIHITTFLGLAAPDVESINSFLKRDLDNFKAFSRNAKGLKITGRFIQLAYEFELLNHKWLLRAKDGEPNKQKLIQQFLKRDFIEKGLDVPDVVLLVHAHGISNFSQEELLKVVRDRYKRDSNPIIKTTEGSGVYIGSFYGDKSLDENLDKVASYPFKNATKYKHTFIGSDLGQESFTYEELGTLVGLYHEVQGIKYKSLCRKLEV